MNEFCFEYEQAPWEAALSGVRSGEKLSAVRFLTLLEGEEEYAVEEAFALLEQRHITLDVTELPKDYGTGEGEKRLRREEMLVGTGKLLENLTQDDPLRIYLEELAGIPAAGDPQLLAEKTLDGTDSDRQRLADVTISRAVAAAQTMTGRGVFLLDLIQEASLGLWQSILFYEGGDFEAHADWFIHQYLAKAVTLQAREKGVGTKMKSGMERYRSVDKQLLTELGRNPTVEEIAVEMGISPEAAMVYQDMLQAARTMEKVKEPPKEEQPEDDQAVEDTAYFQSRQRVLDMLSGLTEQEASVLTMRFGLDGKAPCSPQEIGQKLNITADEAVALEAAALAKLRKEG